MVYAPADDKLMQDCHDWHGLNMLTRDWMLPSILCEPMDHGAALKRMSAIKSNGSFQFSDSDRQKRDETFGFHRQSTAFLVTIERKIKVSNFNPELFMLLGYCFGHILKYFWQLKRVQA